MNDHLFGKELFIRFTVRVFREFLSNFVCVLLFLFDIEGGMWDVTLLIPDHAFLFSSEKNYVFLSVCSSSPAKSTKWT